MMGLRQANKKEESVAIGFVSRSARLRVSRVKYCMPVCVAYLYAVAVSCHVKQRCVSLDILADCGSALHNYLVGFRRPFAGAQSPTP